jgi:hypothetical protein
MRLALASRETRGGWLSTKSRRVYLTLDVLTGRRREEEDPGER